MSLLRRFVVKDSVEGALEVRLELAGAVGSYGARMRRGLLVAAIATALAIASLTPAGLVVLRDVWDVIRGGTEATLPWLAQSALQALMTLLAWALGVTILVFLLQSTRFVGVLRGRNAALERMGSEAPPEGGHEKVRRPDVGGDRPIDPALALVGIAREVEEQIPQLDRMIKYGAVYALLLWWMQLFQALIIAAGLTTLPAGWVLPVLALQAVALVTLTISTAGLAEILSFLRYYAYRARSLEAFVAMGPCTVPSGPDPVGKYLGCLKAQGVIEAGAVPAIPAELEGRDGRLHGFDAAAGGPGSRVLVRAFARMPVLDEVRALREAAEDVARRDGELPSRVVALVGPGDGAGGDVDIPDELYRYLLDSPIMDTSGTWTRTVQVVSECEGHYCPVPFIAPEG